MANGTFEVTDKVGTKVRIVLNGDTGDVTAGGDGRGGDIVVSDGNRTPSIWLTASGSETGIGAGPAGGGGGFKKQGDDNNQAMAVQVMPSQAVVLVDGNGAISIGEPAKGVGGLAHNRAAVLRATADKQGDRAGELLLRDGLGRDSIWLRAVQGDAASMIVGGDKRSGWIVFRNADGKDAAYLSGHDGNGLLELRGKDGLTRIWVRAGNGVNAGQPDSGGTLVVQDGSGNPIIRLETMPGLAAEGQIFPKQAAGRMVLTNGGGADSIVLDGQAGDILLQNSDCAEDFDVEGAAELEPGTVLALTDSGRLDVACRPYDRRVAGVVSGAGALRPGIVLGRVPGAAHRKPIALSGTVMCKVDASDGPINIGDPLTSSRTPGHAMAALDYGRAFGAVLGKAMASLADGRGMIKVLVALQ
jgi:hypothetical protein